MVKIPTMTDARDEQGNPLPDGARLRDVSLVAPRPLLTEYLDLHIPAQRPRPGAAVSTIPFLREWTAGPRPIR